MFASLKNRTIRVLIIGVVPAALGGVLIGDNFARGDSRIQNDGPGGSGYCVATTSGDTATDDGPGLGGGYGPSGGPDTVALDGPGSSTPYVLD